MITRIEIIPTGEDSRGKTKKNWLHSLGFNGQIKNVKVADVYTTDKKFTNAQLKEIASMLTNPVTHTSSVNKSAQLNGENYIFEVGFLPGVKDNVSGTAREGIEDLLKEKFTDGEDVYFTQVLYVSGDLSKIDAQKIAENLANPLIQRVHLKSKKQYLKDGGMDKIAPKVKLTQNPKVSDVDLNVSDEELVLIGKKGILDSDGTRRGPLALDLAYMKAIQAYFQKLGRNPTDIEIESIAQTWSEHCKHTIFADPIDEVKDGLYKSYIKKATEIIRKKKGKNDFCVSVFTDNSGAIEFDSKYLVTHKAETHNSPSALDPFGGSITGIVGVNRDSIGFGLGAKPIVNTYGFCFADPKDEKPLYKGPKFTQKMLSPRKIMEGVVAGVNSGGNCSGIPSPQGFVYFDKRFKGKPLVFVGTVGLIPRKAGNAVSYKKKAQPGDYIVMVGGRVGLDGIHGATFSSEAMDTGSPATAVQIGDPITQKKLSDALVKEARDLNLYSSITDNGAGGLSCSVAEMARESNGCLIELDKVPVKYPGLEPWQIWISESQERMTLSIPKNNWPKFSKLMKNRGVEATVIGKFTNSGFCEVIYKGKKIMNVDLNFLHDGLPERKMETVAPKQSLKYAPIPKQRDLNEPLFQMLKRLNITSFEFISSQYDHEVQSGSVLKPLQGKGRVNGEVSVTRPVLSSTKGVVLSQGLYPSYTELDPYAMAASSIDTAVRNVVAAGADPEKIAILDNFCWCSSTEPERLYQLKKSVQACFDTAVGFGTPFISGKDSMFNDFKGFDAKGKETKISVLPTLLISSISVVDDVAKVVSIDSKSAGDLVYILGDTFEELAGSEYGALLSEKLKKPVSFGNVPQVNTTINKKLYQQIYKAIQKDLITSSIAVTRGGLLVALAKKAIAGGLGMEISLQGLPGIVSRSDLALFSESQGRVVVTIDPNKKAQFEKAMIGASFRLLGKVNQTGQFVVKGLDDKVIVKTEIDKLHKAYKQTFKGY